MTAQKFWESFSNKIEKKRNVLEKCWDSKGTSSGETEFTKTIKRVIKEAITEAIEENFENVIDK